MKKFSKFLSLPLAFVYLFVSVVGCTTNDSVKPLEPLQQKAILNAKKAMAFYNSFVNKKTKESDYSRSSGVLTQEILDEYLVSAELQPGSITIETVNQIIESIADDRTFNQKIGEMDFSSYAKNKILQMNQTGVIDNLHLQVGFQSLPLEEKETLLNTNELMRAYLQDPNTTDVPCPSGACTVTFMLLGIATGTAICGPPCGVAGGIIGFIIGNEMK